MHSTNKEFGILEKPMLKYLFWIALTGFITLTVFVLILPPTIVDKWFSLELQENGNAFFDDFMTAVSSLGNFKYSIPMTTAVSLVFLLFKFKREALFIFLTMISGLISSVVKYLINRPRPAKDLVRVLEITRQQSFPSGHVLFYTVFFGFLMFLMFKLKSLPMVIRLIIATVCLTIIILISISRVYLGAHWLSDVLAGYLLGYCCLYLLINFYLNRYQLFRTSLKTKLLQNSDLT